MKGAVVGAGEGEDEAPAARDCSVVSLGGTMARSLLAPALMLRVQEKTHTRSFTSALQLTAAQRDEVKDQWVDWDGIKANPFDPFSQLPAAHETVLWKSLNSRSLNLLIPTRISSVFLQHCSITSRDLTGFLGLGCSGFWGFFQKLYCHSIFNSI